MVRFSVSMRAVIEKASFALIAGILVVCSQPSISAEIKTAPNRASSQKAEQTAPNRLGTLPKVPASAAAVMPVSAVAASKLVWQRDLQKGLQRAARSKKLVLVDVYTDWCGWCHKLDSDTYSNPQVINYVNNQFVCVKIDAEDGAFGQEAAKKYGIRAFPATLVLEPSGKMRGVFYGFRNAQEFPGSVDKVLAAETGEQATKQAN